MLGRLEGHGHSSNKVGYEVITPIRSIILDLKSGTHCTASGSGAKKEDGRPRLSHINFAGEGENTSGAVNKPEQVRTISNRQTNQNSGRWWLQWRRARRSGARGDHDGLAAPRSGRMSTQAPPPGGEQVRGGQGGRH